MAKYQNVQIPVAKDQVRKLLGNYFQEGPEGSFQEMAIYQNLLGPSVAKTQVRKLPGNDLQQGAEGSFQEEAKYQNLQPMSVAKITVRSFLETTFRRALKVVSRK